jgi:hypothetical protein
MSFVLAFDGEAYRRLRSVSQKKLFSGCRPDTLLSAFLNTNGVYASSALAHVEANQ